MTLATMSMSDIGQCTKLPKHYCSPSASFLFDPRINENIFQVPFILTFCENTVFITFKPRQTHLFPHAEIIGRGAAARSPEQETATLLPASDRVGIVRRCSGWPGQVAVEESGCWALRNVRRWENRQTTRAGDKSVQPGKRRAPQRQLQPTRKTVCVHAATAAICSAVLCFSLNQFDLKWFWCSAGTQLWQLNWG